MITATPNSVRWDHVNRVTYRFQALNFQSDVLEALVLNSPPLTRKSRRKPAIRIPVDQNSNKQTIKFVKPKHRAKRSFSLDDSCVSLLKEDEPATTDLAKYRLSLTEKRIDFDGGGKLVESRSHGEAKAGSKGPRNGFISVKTRNETSVSDDEDLESKSKECLIRMVNDLRKQITQKRTASATTHHENENEATSLICSQCKRKMEETAQDDEDTINEEGEVKETLIAQMKQLETEVQRTRNIAVMFENELSCLRDKFSSVVIKPNNTHAHDGKEAVPTKLDRHGVRQVGNSDTPQQNNGSEARSVKIVINGNTTRKNSTHGMRLVDQMGKSDTARQNSTLRTADTPRQNGTPGTHLAEQIVNSDTPRQSNELGTRFVGQSVKSDASKQSNGFFNTENELEESTLLNSGSNLSCLDDITNLRKCGTVSAVH